MPERTLLLVEDEAVIAMMEAAMLRDNGYAVLVAASGAEAVALASEDLTIDLVLMDIDLGRGMDGTDAAREILARRNIPVVFLSSHTEPVVVEKTEGITSYGYVVKNSGDTVLLASMKMAFRLYEANRTLDENRRRLSEANQIMSGILENTHMMAAYLDTSFNFIWVNGTYAATCGRDPSFFPGKNHFDLYPHPENHAIFRRVVETGRPFYVEAKPFEFPDHPERGVTYWDWSLFPVTDAAGSVGGLVFTLADVTNRIRAEKKMKLLADMVDNAPGSITVHDYGGNFLYANRKTFRIHGYDALEFNSINLRSLDVPESEKLMEERVRKIDEEGGASFEVRHYKKDGTSFPLEVSAKKILWDGAPAVLSIATDITERKEREREREASIAILRLINEKSDLRELMRSVAAFMREWSGCEAVGIRLANGDDYPYYETTGFPHRFVELESSLCTRDLDGQIARDEVGDPVLECMCGNIIRARFDASKPFFTERGSFWTSSTTELLAGTTESDRQSSTRNRCNGMGYESVALVPLRAGAETHGLLQLNDTRRDRFTPSIIETIERLCASIAVALSNRKLVERLAESEKKFHTMVDFTYDWEIWMAPDGRLIHVSPSCERITGYTQDEFLMNPRLLKDIVHTDDRSGLISHMEAVLQGRQSADDMRIDYRILHRNGSVVWIGHRCSPVRDSDGHWFGLRISNRDITARKNAEEALRESEETARALLNATNESAFLMDVDGTILAFNSTMAERLGIHCEDLPGRNVYALLPGETAAFRRAKAAEVIASKSPVRFEDERAGIVFENTIYPIIDVAGEVTRLAVFGADITERKRTEELLRKGAEEKEALLRELQHRIKNTLAMITSLVHMETRDSCEPAARDVLENIRSRISTLSGLYSMLYSTGAVRQVRLDGYLRMIADSVVSAYAKVGAGIELGVAADEILIDTKRASSVGLIVNELLMNAFKYAFSGGRRGRVDIGLSGTEEGIELVVSDNGVGLPDGFDPARSEGFGLRLVGMLLDQLGGTLSHRTAHGTTFTMTIPPET